MADRPGDDFDRDILDIIPARYDADADSRQARAGSRLRATVTLVAAVVAVGGIVAAGWHFMGGKKAVGPGIPVIKADERPIKIRPDDRGGMQVPNQDKLIYERLEPGEGDSKVERLLPAPEKPQAPPKVAAPPAPAPVAETPKPVAPAPAPVAQAPAPEPIKPKPPEPVVAAKPVEPILPKAMPAAPAPAPVPAPAPAVAKAAPAGGDYLIQLGALRSAPDAEKEWSRIQKANADLLGTLKSDVVRVELGEKGIFWRLRAGPLSEAAAKQMCTELKARNQGCIIARK
ncbi:SPOR domain-containing protein [Magnetospirillum moscoviense]|uniref:Energy transducer TonB n=1 Tax=Magnetospirillum moscoviense TaxID=1437059 RepID=A0A178ML25_9PROT|nr:SPOR domain-containing protein [Magnetospirillum moscoviense]MBF0323662.1 SPOR domain-containing protein [Alphaproteobacteria bacterium]OAN48847.1 energy transducer TonB [Magnetospirillum moscoviense]